jgi:DnaJ family protein C protein 28
MSAQKRGKRPYRQRLERLRTELEERQLPVEATQKSHLPQSDKERQALVERRIQEAMENGDFDHLPGQGKPLALASNPYLESGQELAYGLLKNNNLAPEWIERDKEIRQELKAIRDHLRLAWQNWAGESTWQATAARFEDPIKRLNRKIEDFNLIVPIISCQRDQIRLTDEILRIQTDETDT